MSPRFAVRPLASAAAVAVALSACSCSLNPPETGNGQAKLVPFKSADELLEYFREQASAAHGGMRGGPFGGMFGGMPLGAPLEDAATGGAEGDGSGGETPFTSTNVQEEGVDEADIVKTDGEYLYIARENSLRIVRAVPLDELEEVGRVDIEDGFIHELYLYGDRILAIVSGFGFRDGVIAYEIWPPYYAKATLRVYEIDISDRSEPRVTGSIELDGSLVSSRLTRDRLILVLTIVPNLPAEPTPLSIGRMSLEEMMPRARADSTTMEMVPWQRWLHPESPDGYSVTAIVTLDAADIGTIVDSTAVMASASTIYATTDAVYLTDAEWGLDGEPRETTAIHKFAFDAEGGAEYVASGSVPGRLLNQFSLSEHEGYLRVATHIAPAFFFGGGGVPGVVGSGAAEPAAPVRDAGGSSAAGQEREPTELVNAVYVLGVVQGEERTELAIVGRAEDLAPGERIYSARFVGDHGFLVTFRQVDPLFVLDLSDPANPQVVGELKIPGYSDYLHPLDDTHLLGVGRSVVENEFGGVVPDAFQLSLFDVSDWSNPTLVEQIEAGGPGSYSDVSYNHKAFAFLPGENVLALPAWINNNDSYDDIEFDFFSGVICWRIDPAAGFTEMGRVPAVGSDAYGTWGLRAVIIGQNVYSVNSLGVNAAPMLDLAQPVGIELER